jgi:rhodanese-related sulfurtransferase
VDLGYTDVSIMPDGIDGWIKKGMKVAKGDQPA